MSMGTEQAEARPNGAPSWAMVVGSRRARVRAKEGKGAGAGHLCEGKGMERRTGLGC